MQPVVEDLQKALNRKLLKSSHSAERPSSNPPRNFDMNEENFATFDETIYRQLLAKKK